MEIYNFISLIGFFVLIGFAWILSADRNNMNWRLIFWGIVFQFLFALFIFKVPAGSKFFLFINGAVLKILDSASAGAKFIFGILAFPPGTVNEYGEKSLGFFLAFQAFPTIIFFSALISILYFLNIMPRIIRAFAVVFTKLMRISGAESLVAVSNIFLGVESALTAKPHLNEMTKSELCTVLSVGMATVASNVMAVYVFALKAQFPSIAGHLVSASFLSVPAALIMSKVLLPEDGIPKTLGQDIHPYYEKEKSLFESIIAGADTGLKVITGIVALLIAVLGLVALLDMGLGFLGGKINIFFCINVDWSLKNLLGYIFYPFTLLLGVPYSDAGTVSAIIGERLIVTEVVAYQDLAAAMGKGLLHHNRSAAITVYALCGFAHVASLAIFTGGVSAIAPDKKRVISAVALRALLSATLACLLTACVAGVFFTDNSILLGNS